MSRSYNDKLNKRKTVLKSLKHRLRQALGKRSAIMTSLERAYREKKSGLTNMREIVRTVAAQVPGGMGVCGNVSKVTKRTELMRRLVAMLENAGYGKGNQFRASNFSGLPEDKFPMQRMGSGDIFSGSTHVSRIQPPFPYATRGPAREIVEPHSRVMYTQPLGIVTPSPVEGPVLCPRAPPAVLVDNIHIVQGIKHVRDFYSGNVIHVRLTDIKFKDGAEKCQYFAVLREAFDKYRELYAKHSDPSDVFWYRRVMTPWNVYLDEGVDTFDGPIITADTRKIFENDMHISLLKATDTDESATLANVSRVRIGRGSTPTIPICMTRFDGRDNVGHVRSEMFTFTVSATGYGDGTANDAFNVKNILKFMFKTDQFEVKYHDWFPPHVRRMVIEAGEGDDVPIANAKANERAINFLKADEHNALFVIDAKMENENQKEYLYMLDCLIEYMQPGSRGYNNLAVVIMKNKKADIAASLPVTVANFIDNSSVFQWMNAKQASGGDLLWEPVNSSALKTAEKEPVERESALKFVDGEEKEVQFPGVMALVRFQPSIGFFGLAQKRRLDGDMLIDDSLRQDIYLEQVSANKPIYIDDKVLRGFTTPESGRYFFGPSNPDSSLYIAKLNKFTLFKTSDAYEPFITPSKIPSQLVEYLRNADYDPVVVLGVTSQTSVGACLDARVQQFCRKNRISSELIGKSNFSNVGDDEYVLIRTQRSEGTGSVVMYQYKFKADDLAYAQKIVKATDLDEMPKNTFESISIMDRQ